MKKKNNDPVQDPLRVLILEDNPADAELVARELRRAALAFTSLVVEGKKEFSDALDEFQPQVILSDFMLPGFDGLAALKIARRQAPDTPFIFVSGSIGEEKAIETLALGASDYIFKDNLARLGPAVKRVLAAAELKKLKQEAEESLVENERMFSTLVANLPGFVYRCRNDHDWTMEYISPGCREVTGYAPEDFLLNRKLAFNDIIHPDQRETLWQEWQERLQRREPFEFEYRIARLGRRALGMGARPGHLRRGRIAAVPGGLHHRHHSAPAGGRPAARERGKIPHPGGDIARRHRHRRRRRPGHVRFPENPRSLRPLAATHPSPASPYWISSIPPRSPWCRSAWSRSSPAARSPR